MTDLDMDAIRQLAEAMPGAGDPTTRLSWISTLSDAILSSGVPVGQIVELDTEESNAMHQLLGCMRQINAWRYVNGSELTAAVHVLQGFIIQHMLHRLNPGQWSDWTRKETT